MNGEALSIGVIASPWVAVPPLAYGGTELMIDSLCTALRRAGHSVTLFATGDSTCPVTRQWLFATADPDRIGSAVLELRHAAAAYDALSDVDVVHDHTLAGLFLSARTRERSVITTIHGPFDDDLADLYGRIDKRIPVVAISHDQASRAPAGLHLAGVIHHGIDLARYPFESCPGEHVVFLGRMSANKGVETAVVAAREAGVPLLIAAKMREPAEMRYFDAKIRPHLGGGIEYVGEAGFDEKVRLLTSAKALINPIQWPEPFGLVMIEAMACGTPVVGYRAGAAPEIVEHGRTGFLVSDVDGLVECIAKVDEIDRAACRAAVAEHFTSDRMAADYVQMYRQALEDDTEPDDAHPNAA